MRCLIAVVVLLATVVAGSAFAGDPPGGPGWYQLSTDVTLTVPTNSGDLLIAGGTPGFLVGVATDGSLRLRFERGIATWLGREITADGGFGPMLTIDIDPALVRAFVRQPLSKAEPPATRKGGAEPGALGAISGGGGGVVTGTGVGAVGMRRDTVVTVEDTRRVVRVSAPSTGAAPEGRRGSPELFPPPPSAASSGASGGQARIIARDEHEASLAKVLKLLGEDGANCETKSYGPGWISICEPLHA